MRSFPLPDPHPGLDQARSDHPSGPWETMDSTERRSLRIQLLENQNEICAWCEVGVGADNSHIDHIRAKGQYPQFTFAIGNLIAACQTPHTCGHGRAHKGDLPMWVHPYETAQLQAHFHYNPDGGIRPADKLSDDRAAEADDAINRQLNLNDRVMKERRESQTVQIRSYLGQDLTPETIATFFPNFPSLTQQILS